LRNLLSHWCRRIVSLSHSDTVIACCELQSLKGQGREWGGKPKWNGHAIHPFGKLASEELAPRFVAANAYGVFASSYCTR
jgi:hypothetical protein